MKAKIRLFAVLFCLGLILMPARSIRVSAETSYPYYIKVNRKACVVTIYEKDEKGKYTVPIKAMLCSPGWDTPLGKFKIPQKLRWHVLMGNVWGQYCSRINKGVLFHSVWYYEKDPATMSNKQYNNLGTVCSHGCVRLNVEDVKWIYDNCPIGTTVEIYDSKDPGPLGKPKGLKVSTANRMGYDPTDIWSKGNPYLKTMPKLSGMKNISVNYGGKINLLKGVKAVSSTSADITSDIKTTIRYGGKKVKKIDTTKIGSYYVTYTVSDGLGRKASKEITVTVKDTVAPKITGAKNLYINNEDELDEDFLLESVSAVWHGEEMDEDSVTVVYRKQSEEEGYKVYSLIYKVKASNGKSDRKEKTLYVDTKAPEFEGVADCEISIDDVVDEAFVLKNVNVKDNSGTVKKENIKTTITKESDTVYKVQYSVKDKSGNETTAEAVYTVTNMLSFTGIKDQTIAENVNMGSYQALQGVKAFNGTNEITGQIQVQISNLVDGKYTVTYTIKDWQGHEKTAQAVFTVEKAEKTEEKKDETAA